jgi:hypothetical protein
MHDDEGYERGITDASNIALKLLPYSEPSLMYASKDVGELIDNEYWAMAYCARYGRMSPKEFMQMQRADAFQFIEALSEIIKKENAPSPNLPNNTSRTETGHT